MSRIRQTRLLGTQWIPRGIVGLGIAIILSHVGEWVLFPGSFQQFVETGLPVSLIGTFPFLGVIILGGLWLERDTLHPERYPRIAKWCLGGLLFFTAINVVIIVTIFTMFVPADQLAKLWVGWIRFAVTLGAGGGLFIGIIEARAIERALVAERETIRAEKLEQQTAQLEFFNSILRHDVLNGMTVIRGRAEILKEELTDPEEQKHTETILRWSDDIVQVIQRVRRILNTLTEEVEFVKTPINLSAVVRDEIGRISDTYPAVSFETDIPDDVCVCADDLLCEVLGNLLTNAVEHNDEDGLCVSVTVTEESQTATVRIADTGVGIPVAKRQSIFGRGAAGQVKTTGSGFGLFFVDSMVTVYGGTVHVEDNQPEGAVFVLELPRPVRDVVMADDERPRIAQ